MAGMQDWLKLLAALGTPGLVSLIIFSGRQRGEIHPVFTSFNDTENVVRKGWCALMSELASFPLSNSLMDNPDWLSKGMSDQ